jgi:hypothetical protein
MTLAATWCSYENPEVPVLWMASDSRISAEKDRLIDEGVKVFEIPVVCRGANPAGHFDQTYFEGTVGLACAGGTLVFQNVYGTLVPMLGNLISPQRAVPSVRDIAGLIGRLMSLYVRSLGAQRPDAHRVSIVTGGLLIDDRPVAFDLSPRIDRDGLVEFLPTEVTLAPGQIHFIGHSVAAARGLANELIEKDEPGAPRDRAALNVIRAFINDPKQPTIGGDIQIGHTVRGMFRRVASVAPGPAQSKKSFRRLNSIELDELGLVGECVIGTEAMTTP